MFLKDLSNSWPTLFHLFLLKSVVLDPTRHSFLGSITCLDAERDSSDTALKSLLADCAAVGHWALYNIHVNTVYCIAILLRRSITLRSNIANPLSISNASHIVNSLIHNRSIWVCCTVTMHIHYLIYFWLAGLKLFLHVLCGQDIQK